MACADAAFCASVTACGAVVLAPALPCTGVHLSPALWALEVASVAPLVCCTLGAPTAAACAVAAPHWVEWDEDEGKLVGVEDDTLLCVPARRAALSLSDAHSLLRSFGEDGGMLDGSDVYDPRWQGQRSSGGAEIAGDALPSAPSPAAATPLQPANAPLTGAGLKEE